MASIAAPGLNAYMTGRRGCGRARLGIQARLETVSGTYSCRVDDLSTGGARLYCEPPLRAGRQVNLILDGHDLFGEVVWVTGAKAGLAFDRPIDRNLVIAFRNSTPEVLQREAGQLERIARDWVTGRPSDG